MPNQKINTKSSSSEYESDESSSSDYESSSSSGNTSSEQADQVPGGVNVKTRTTAV